MRNTPHQPLDYRESVPSKLASKSILRQRPLEVMPRSASALTHVKTASSDLGSDFAAIAPVQFLSNRNLDFCLLAVCSCVLAVLCHQTVVIPSSGASSTLSAAPLTAQLDFTLKSALFTSARQKDDTKEFLQNHQTD